MGDSTGKFSHGFHLLRFKDALFESLAFCDIPENSDHADDPAAVIAIGALGGKKSSRHVTGTNQFFGRFRVATADDSLITFPNQGRTFSWEDF